MKLHIAVDMDDVLLEFFRSVCHRVNKDFGQTVDYEACSDWDRNPVKDLTCFGDGRTWWDWLRDNVDIWASFPCTPDALTSVRRLQEQGHFLELVTSKPEWAEHIVAEWLDRNGFLFDVVTIAPTGVPKHELSNADVLIDDAPHNIRAWVNADPRRHGVVFTRPWNSGDSFDDCSTLRVQRADNWSQVLKAVDDIADSHRMAI